MGHEIAQWGVWILGLILLYILVSNYKGTVQIGTTISKGLPPIIQSLQGVGPGYPPPAR
jgi:hypothetical protein